VLTEDVIEAIEEGQRIVPASTFCRFSAGLHATLAALAKRSSWPRAVVLRAVCGWITEARRVAGCP
jgi:hypothetical protein